MRTRPAWPCVLGFGLMGPSLVLAASPEPAPEADTAASTDAVASPDEPAGEGPEGEGPEVVEGSEGEGPEVVEGSEGEEPEGEGPEGEGPEGEGAEVVEGGLAPAEEEPAPAPTPEGGLPAYDADLPRYEEVPPAVEGEGDGSGYGFDEGFEPAPPSGHGRLAVGGILLGGGAALTVISATMIVRDTDILAWIPGAVLGAGALTAGLGVTLTGVGYRRRYRRWAEGYGGRKALPPPGTGLIAGGITCLAAGGFGMLIGGVSLTLQDEDDPPYGQVMLPLAATSVVTGIALVIPGAKRKGAYRKWDETRLAPTLGVLPGVRRRPAGVSVGLAGQF
jgi:hypothetical protein